MRQVLGGYTILELMIVLAISVTILISAAIAIGGSSAHTQFSQSMRDVSSKMQDWINDVTDGFAGGTPSQYNCTLNSSNQPQINAGSGSGSAAPNCVFLGKAIQITTQGSCPGCVDGQSSKIFVYSIFGRRTLDTNGTLADNIVNANPMPAVGSIAGAGNSDLTETYNILDGAEVKSVTSSAGSAEAANSHMVGFFTSLNAQGSGVNGAQSLNSYAFRLDTNAIAANQSGGGTVASCLKLTSDTCYPNNTDPNSWPEGLNSWKICFAAGANNETAQLTVSSIGGLGAQTKLEFIGC